VNYRDAHLSLHCDYVCAAACDIQGLKSSHCPVMSATDSRHYCRAVHLDCTDLAAATELYFAERKEECNADCRMKVAFLAEADSAAEDVRMNSSLVLLAALVATVQSVLEVLEMDLDMGEAESIAAAENMG
jgi:hypothetical protein